MTTRLHRYLTPAQHATIGRALDRLAQRGVRFDPAAVQTYLLSLRVVISGASSRKAGSIDYKRREIMLHVQLKAPGREQDHDATLMHEVAHGIAWAIWRPNGGGHGRGWRAVMHALGLPADRCHRLDYIDKTFTFPTQEAM